MNDSEELEQLRHRMELATLERCRQDFLFFARILVVPGAKGAAEFDLLWQDFQREFLTAVAPSLHAIRDRTEPPLKRVWLERTKKSGKDSDLGICILWLMAMSEKPVKVQVVAANQDQAGIILERVNDILVMNPWVQEYVQVVRHRISSKRHQRTVWCKIEATDASKGGGGAQGETPDLLILNELVHVSKWGTMEAHFNNATGVPWGMVIISTNAGIKGTKAELWRNEAIASEEKGDGRWRTFIYNKRSPWVNADDVAEAKRRDPIGTEYKRLWEGKWVSGTGDALDEECIQKAFNLPGPSGRDDRLTYLAGLDLGISHDHAGIFVVGVDSQAQLIKAAFFRSFVPCIPNDKGVKEVDKEAVQNQLIAIQQTYRPLSVWYDPAAGGSFLAQDLRRIGMPMREMTFSSASHLTEMAESLVVLMKGGRLWLYDDAEGTLHRDLGKLSIEVKPPSRYKLTAVRDEYGHADVATALVVLLPEAKLLSGYMGRRLSADDNLDLGENVVLSKEEEDSMPAELRALYEMDAPVRPGPKRKQKRKADTFEEVLDLAGGWVPDDVDDMDEGLWPSDEG